MKLVMRAVVKAALLAALGCGFAWSNPPIPSGSKSEQSHRESAKKADEKPGDTYKSSQQVAPLINIVNSPQAANEGAQQAKQHDEKSSAEWWTVGVAIVAAGIAALATLIAAVQAGLFVWQLRRMKTSNETAAAAAKSALENVRLTEKQFIASHRPWIKVELTHAGDLKRDSAGGWAIWLDFKMTNVGSTPAQNVYPNPGFYAGEGFVDEVKNAQLKLATEFKPIVDTNLAGLTIFPGDSFTVPVLLHVTQAVSEDGELTHAEMGFGDCLPRLFIVGSVHYKSTLGEMPHRTGFIKAFDYFDAIRKKTVLIPKRDSISREELVISPYISGDGYID